MRILANIALVLAVVAGIALATVAPEGYGNATSGTTNIIRTYDGGQKANFLWVDPWVADVEVLFDARGDTHVVRPGRARKIYRVHSKFEIIRTDATPVDFEWGTSP